MISYLSHLIDTRASITCTDKGFHSSLVYDSSIGCHPFQYITNENLPAGQMVWRSPYPSHRTFEIARLSWSREREQMGGKRCCRMAVPFSSGLVRTSKASRLGRVD